MYFHESGYPYLPVLYFLLCSFESETNMALLRQIWRSWDKYGAPETNMALLSECTSCYRCVRAVSNITEWSSPYGIWGWGRGGLFQYSVQISDLLSQLTWFSGWTIAHCAPLFVLCVYSLAFQTPVRISIGSGRQSTLVLKPVWSSFK
jgi:hypothetical protein